MNIAGLIADRYLRNDLVGSPNHYRVNMDIPIGSPGRSNIFRVIW